MRGRPFGFIGLLCVTWISTRVIVLTYATSVKPVYPLALTVPTSAKHHVEFVKTEISPAHFYCRSTCGSGASAPRLSAFKPSVRQAPPLHTTVAVALMPIQPRRQNPDTGATLSPFPSIAFAKIRAPGAQRPVFYAYSFWRNGAAPLGFARYGGGQSGVIASYGPGSQLSLVARTAVAHSNLREREIAVGARWSPDQNIPASVTVERRFRNSASDVFAAYVAGGKSGISIPLGFSLDTFGQAGIVSGQRAGYFFDAHARAERNFVPHGPLPVRAGAGIWTGGQQGAARIDIGPTISTDLSVGRASVRVNADWRFRVAGTAQPGNGPALTLSTSF